MLRRFSSFTILLLIIVGMMGCRTVSQRDLIGTWVLEASSRRDLPADLRDADAKFVLSGDGTFICSQVPGLFYFPEKIPARLEGGHGTWRLDRVDGNQSLLLSFQQIDNWKGQLPYGTQLFISRKHIEFFLGDPDEGRAVNFYKQ